VFVLPLFHLCLLSVAHNLIRLVLTFETAYDCCLLLQVPLNLFLFQDEAALKHPTCIPLWVFCFALAQLFGIFNIIQKVG